MKEWHKVGTGDYNNRLVSNGVAEQEKWLNREKREWIKLPIATEWKQWEEQVHSKK